MLKKISTCIVFFCIIIIQHVNAQQDGNKIKNEAFKYYKNGDYYKSLPLLLEADILLPNATNIKDKIAYIYTLNKATRNLSIPYFEQAIKNGISDPIIYFRLGTQYHYISLWDNAISAFNKFRELTRQNHPNDRDAALKINQCHAAKIVTKSNQGFNPVLLGSSFNTIYNEINCQFNDDETVMMFSSMRPGCTGGKQNEKLKPHENGKYYYDVFISEKVEGGWTVPDNTSVTINTNNHDKIACILPNNQLVYFNQIESKNDVNLVASKYQAHEWGKSEKMERPIYTNSYEGSCSITPDGKNLYFVSDRADGVGGKDIYVSFKTPNGKWSEPKNLGPSINTIYDEESPYIAADGTLYFASNGITSIGGFDIFKTNFIDGAWSKPINMGYGINTTDDELYFSISKTNDKKSYLSSNRLNSIGGFDLYQVDLSSAIDTEIIASNNQAIIDERLALLISQQIKIQEANALADKNIAEEKTLADKKASDDKSLSDKKAADDKAIADKKASDDKALADKKASDDKALADKKAAEEKAKADKKAAEEKAKADKKAAEDKAMADKKASDDKAITDKKSIEDLQLILSQNDATNIIVDTIQNNIVNKALEQVAMVQFEDELGKADFITLDIDSITASVAAMMNIINATPKTNIPAPKPRVLIQNIYYEFNQSKLTTSSAEALEKLYLSMRFHPEIIIQLMGHTDSKGADEYNTALAQHRVTAVSNFLKLKGIAPQRIINTGFGEHYPYAKNNEDTTDLADGRAANRRVEIRIINPDSASIIIESVPNPIRSELILERNESYYAQFEGLVFKVEIISSKNPINSRWIKGYKDLMTEELKFKSISYLTGTFKQFEEANKFREQVTYDKQISTPKVVAFYNGKRIPLDTAIRIETDIKLGADEIRE